MRRRTREALFHHYFDRWYFQRHPYCIVWLPTPKKSIRGAQQTQQPISRVSQIPPISYFLQTGERLLLLRRTTCFTQPYSVCTARYRTKIIYNVSHSRTDCRQYRQTHMWCFQTSEPYFHQSYRECFQTAEMYHPLSGRSCCRTVERYFRPSRISCCRTADRSSRQAHKLYFQTVDMRRVTHVSILGRIQILRPPRLPHPR